MSAPKFRVVALAAVAVASAAVAQAPKSQLPEGVKRVADLTYATVGDKKLLLDLYLPEKAEKPLPVVVGIHGGGWASGSKEGGQGSWLAKHGYAVAVINYRLSGEAVFPAQIEDCKAAVRWLRANAKKYDLDPDRFGATGHSAGGHLTSLLATTGDAKDFDKGENLDFSSRIRAAAPLSGPTDLLLMDAHAPKDARLKHDAANSPEARLIGGPIQDNKAKAAKANPIAYVGKSTPPFLIVHGDRDATVPYHQAELLFDALKSAGVSVHLHTVTGGGHGRGSREANDKVVAFFDKHLKGNGPAGKPTAETSESKGSDGPQPGGNRPLPPGLTWDRIRDREDANEDGKVTKEEFKGPPPLFDQLDRNRDGVLTKEDFDAAPPVKEPARDDPKPVSPPGDQPRSETPTAAPANSSREVRPPVGLFVCRGPNPTPEKEVNFPFIDGWLVRPGWDTVEPQEGKYEWAYIDAEIALAKKLRKKITLSVLGGPQTPEWVYKSGAKPFEYTMPVGRKRDAKLPLLWDEAYLKAWAKLIAALGKRYDGEGTVVLVHITGATGNGLEMQLPFTPPDRAKWEKVGYTPEKAVRGWKRIIDTFADAFPNKPLDIDIHPVLGSDQVAADVAAYGSKKLGKRFGLFGGWLSGKDASEDRHHAGMHALAKQYGPKGFTAWQMVASQTANGSNPKFDNLFASRGLKAAVEQGMTWNARYFEIWETDATNEKLHPVLKELAEKLKK